MSESWHCLQISAQNPFQFSGDIVGNQKRGEKYICNSVTVSHVKQEEALSRAGQLVPPNRGKTLYIGNQEMSDELRNELQKKCRRLGGITGAKSSVKKGGFRSYATTKLCCAVLYCAVLCCVVLCVFTPRRSPRRLR